MGGKESSQGPNQGGRMRLARPHTGTLQPRSGRGNQAREVAYARYNALVSGVLEALRTAGYLARHPLYRWPGEERWCIGDWDRAAARMRPLVEVELDFAHDGNPRAFICRIGERTASAALTEADLAHALAELHRRRAR